MAVGPQVEFPVAKQPIDVLQRQFSFSAFACDVQYSFGVLHYAYLPVVFRRNHLPSFAMYRAFPGSDYYEGSVAIGVSPRRQSRVPFDFGDWALLAGCGRKVGRSAAAYGASTVSAAFGM